MGLNPSLKMFLSRKIHEQAVSNIYLYVYSYIFVHIEQLIILNLEYRVLCLVILCS